MGKRKYDTHIAEDIKRFVAEGHTRQEACDAFAVPYHVVARACKGMDALAVRNEALRAYKAEGHTMQEVANHFGLTKDTVKNVCKNVAPQRWKYNQYSSVPLDERGRKYVERYAPGFEYAGNYTGHAGTIDLRCKVCGTVQTKATVTVRHPDRPTRCDACYRAAIDARKKEKPKKIKEKPLVLPVRSVRQISLSVCKECGAMFASERAGVEYCSDECRKKKANRYSTRRKDKRLAGVKRDSGIDTKSVFKRDGGVCYICGRMCDCNDFVMKGGTVIAGDWYPSVDHVQPIAHGGTDTWDNVRLAHRRCNYLKSDNPPTTETA